jgi:serine protease DegQ
MHGTCVRPAVASKTAIAGSKKFTQVTRRTEPQMQHLKLVVSAVIASSALLGADPAAATSPPETRPIFRPLPPSRPLPMVSFAPLVEKAIPAVVSIRVIGETLLPLELKPGAPTQQHPQKRPFRSGGSGVIVNAELGLIGTNHHVVRDAISITVGLHDGREAPAKLIGVDSATDIAVIKVDLPNLVSLPIGNSSDLRVGDFVIAIGNPFGLEGTATSGIVSGLMRSDIGYDVYESFIQIDAAVNPGNSGGALVNLDGELVGINTAVGRHGAGAVGIAFAIPINMARRVGTQLYKHGHMPRGSLGLKTDDIPPDQVAKMELAYRRGALITGVAAESPAARAGIIPGSIVIAFNGEPLHNNRDYMAHFGSSAVGDEVELQLVRDRKVELVKLTMSDHDPATTIAQVADDIAGIGGLLLADIEPQSQTYGRVRGIKVRAASRDGGAYAAGLRVDDIIVSLNGRGVHRARQIYDFVESMAPINEVAIIRGRVPYTIQLGK